MPRAYIRLVGIKLQGDFTKDLDAYLRKANRAAAREWLRAVITRVPVWSGEARGSIKFARGPYGTLGRYLNVAIPIVPRVVRRGKNAQTGGEQAKYNFTASNKNYRFYFRSDVIHYIYNDFFPRTDRGAGGQQIVAPWHSQFYAAEAYNREMKRQIANSPKVQQALIRYRIKQ